MAFHRQFRPHHHGHAEGSDSPSVFRRAHHQHVQSPNLSELEGHVQILQKIEEDVSAVRSQLQDMISTSTRTESHDKNETHDMLRRTMTTVSGTSGWLGDYCRTYPHDTVAQQAFASQGSERGSLNARGRSSSVMFRGVSLAFDEEEWKTVTWERPSMSSCCALPILHPEGPIRLVWLAPAFVFVLTEAFLVPFMLAFHVEPDDEQFLGLAFRIIDVYFLMDIVVTFLTGYRDKRGNLAVNPRKIVKKYLAGWFLLDAVAAIPWTWIGDSTVAQVTRGLKVVRLIRLARLLRLAKLRQITEAAETFMEGKYAAELAMGFGKVLMLLFAVSHWCACFWHAVGSEEGGWVAAAESSKDYRGTDLLFAKYTWSLYFTLTTLTTVGYGDITPVTTEECRWVLLLLLTSAVIFSGLLGMLSDLVASVNKEHRLIAAKKRQLARYMAWRAVPRNLLGKVRRYFLFKWGAQKDYDLYEEELKRSLTPTLRSDLCYHIYKDVLTASPFLAWMRGHTACIKHLATSCRSGFHDNGDFLFRTGEEMKDIIILLAGTTVLYRNDTDAEDQEDFLEQDNLFPWMELEGHQAMQKKLLLRQMMTSVIRNMKTRKGKARSIGLSSRSNDMEGHFYGQCKNENLVRGLSELKKFDAVQKSAAMLIQLVWRERIRRRGGGADVQKKSQGHTCYAVDAPAYFGESSLWTPYSTWTTRAAIHEYTIRVKSQVEVVNIPRLAIAVCIEKFSPWLRNRFEVFQAAVLHDRDFLADKESQVSTKPSDVPLLSVVPEHLELQEDEKDEIKNSSSTSLRL